MRIVVDVVCQGPRRPPQGSPVLVQVRDTSLADAPSILVGEVAATVEASSGAHLTTVFIDLQAVPRGATVRVHIDVDRDGRVSLGDFVSTASHSVGGVGDLRLEVPVRPV